MTWATRFRGVPHYTSERHARDRFEQLLEESTEKATLERDGNVIEVSEAMCERCIRLGYPRLECAQSARTKPGEAAHQGVPTMARRRATK